MQLSNSPETLCEIILRLERVWLFLDYDGTLAPFAPTPSHVIVDQDLIDIFRQAAEIRDFLRISIISGRSLAQIEKLVPVSGVLLAGTYGIEYKTWQGNHVETVNVQAGRGVLNQIKTEWHDLIADQSGFFLEDKGYALALHAKWANANEALSVLTKAKTQAQVILQDDHYQISGGTRFLEVAPIEANKGLSIEHFLSQYPWNGSETVFIGDDDKDEHAFKLINSIGGLSVLVSEISKSTQALYRLNDPYEVRRLIICIIDEMKKKRR